jgi:ElaB/YqjD/DUF883 family membrane-anchored ribosome-binding protein
MERKSSHQKYKPLYKQAEELLKLLYEPEKLRYVSKKLGPFVKNIGRMLSDIDKFIKSYRKRAGREKGEIRKMYEKAIKRLEEARKICRKAFGYVEVAVPYILQLNEIAKTRGKDVKECVKEQLEEPRSMMKKAKKLLEKAMYKKIEAIGPVVEYEQKKLLLIISVIGVVSGMLFSQFQNFTSKFILPTSGLTMCLVFGLSLSLLILFILLGKKKR